MTIVIKSILGSVIFAVLLAAAFVLTMPARTNAHQHIYDPEWVSPYSEDNDRPNGAMDDEKSEEKPRDKQKQSQDKKTQARADGAYRYEAQPGDSYTLMSRKAIQAQTAGGDDQLSKAQIIFAETNMTVEAGSPLLNIGQEVVIERAVVNKWVDAAKELSDADRAAWRVYVESADFDTSNVGE